MPNFMLLYLKEQFLHTSTVLKESKYGDSTTIFKGIFLEESFKKLNTRKCLMGRIEITNEVKNNRRSCKTEFLEMQSIITVRIS